MTDYQTSVDWMGAQVTTLADLWPNPPLAMIVGINPAPKSVEVGHYYQGAAGRRQMQRLADAGVFTVTDTGKYVEDCALAAGVGFTDIVRRPTRREVDVTPDELAFGKTVLLQELRERSVPLIICVFAEPVRVLLGHAGPAGIQSATTDWGATVFRMPGPYEKAEKARAVMEALTDLMRQRRG
jgi:double-stranded uracil-DNA glycosylase